MGNEERFEANIQAMLILNARRKLGLMRLRGVPGKLLGQSLLVSIGLGGLIGGIIGLMMGTVIPFYVYEAGVLSWEKLSRVQGPLLMLFFLIVGLVLVLLISRRLVRYATTISPLEASRRVAVSESGQATVRFSILEWLALLIGAYKIASWIFDFQLISWLAVPEDDGAVWTQFVQAASALDRALDFVALPLFVYGLVALLVAQRRLISGLMSSVTYFVGGKLRSLSLQHMSLKPHRTASFLLIVGLMASVSLYPSIVSKSFEDKALRGATVQVGSELHVTINPNDMVNAEQLEQGLGGQIEAIRAVIKQRLVTFQHADVVSLDYIFEAILPGFFFPGYGLSGVPLYLLNDPQHYLKSAIFEEKLGVSANFSAVVSGLKDRTVAASPPVAAFWNLAPGEPVLLGADLNKKPVLVPAGGVIGFLPGMPPRSISDRQSYVSARIDYLNHLANTDAYLAATMDNPLTANLKVLIPRILLLVRMKPGGDPNAVVKTLSEVLRARPLEVRELKRELKKVGGDMFIFLALENMRIYLVGGVLLALIAILAILAGNTADNATLKEFLKKIESHYGKAQRIWLMDRGIPTEEVLEQMRQADPPIQYLVGTPKGRLNRLENQLLDKPWYSARPGVQVKLMVQEGELYVLAHSADRVAKERAIRRRQLKWLWARLKQLSTMTLTREQLLMKLGAARQKAPSAWRLIEIEVAKQQASFTYRLHRQKLRSARRREGRYLLRTNLTETDPAKLWSLYLQLVAVEEAFKNLKGDLAIRPIFHQHEQRIEAHIFVSFLAYCLHVTLTQRLRTLAPGLTARSVLEKFAAVQMIDVHLPTTDGRELTLTRYSQPEPELQLLLDKLKLELPPQPAPKIGAPQATSATAL